MDTKSPNKKRAKVRLRDKQPLITFISRLLLLILSLVLISGGAVISCEDRITFHSYFYDSENIKTEVIRYAKNLQRYYIYFKSFDPTTAERKINEIDSYLKEGKGIVSDSSYDVKSFYTEDEGITDSDEAESKSLIAVYDNPEALYSFNAEELKALTVEEITKRKEELSNALQNYYSVRNYLDTTEHFHYYIYNNSLGRLVATNADNFDKETVYDSISVSDELFSGITFNNTNLSDSFVQNGFECTISIPVSSSSYFIKNEVDSLRRLIKVNRVISSPIASLLAIVFGLLIFIYVFILHRDVVQKANSVIYRQYKKLPLIIKILVLYCLIFGYVFCYEKGHIISQLIAYGNWDSALAIIIASVIPLMVVIMSAESLYKVLRSPKALLEETDIRFIRVSFSNFVFALRTQNYFLIFISVSTALLFISGCVFMLICLPGAFGSFKAMLAYLLMCFPVFILAMVLKLINAHIKLCWYIKEMSLRNIEIIPEQKGLFTEPLNNLNYINNGLKHTMEEAIKNERLKSELITNVSHDLKTPLTSIISYVNLLKELNIDNKDAEEYIDVIENKAIRLKILIDDLFEASKLSSGQMKLEKAPSDVVSLLKQTMGELSCNIEESGIDFKTNLPDSPVILNIDGQKMWRVFDNMLNNILKYSPKGSRAYVDISDKEDRTVITFKNVSNYSLDFDTGELFERFKRGDAARATEGSGLGLSIARSIVELHNGTMSIVTDGDLFKVIIVLYKENKPD